MTFLGGINVAASLTKLLFQFLLLNIQCKLFFINSSFEKAKFILKIKNKSHF